MKKSFRFNLVDVFTDKPLTGNALAVFTQASALSSERMQTIAREMNLSETVFLLPPEAGGHAKLRIFTPRSELPFAGHPVLGSAWILGGPMEMNGLRLETTRGMVDVELIREGDRLHVVWMTQPLPEFSACREAFPVVEALGLSADRTGLLPTIEADNGPRHVLVEAFSHEELTQLAPSSGLARATQAGVLVYFQEGRRCFARYFAPAAGIPEDPATGSAVGPLAAYLVLEGRLDAGQRLDVYQGAEMQRPSRLMVEVADSSTGFGASPDVASSAELEAVQATDREISAIRVGGSAVIVGRGELLI